MEPDLPFSMQTRQIGRKRAARKYSLLWDDFVVDRIDLKMVVENLLGQEEITASQEEDIIDDQDNK